MKKIIIAIDGFSSCGKSTLAKQLAQKLSYIFVDSGAMYRAITLYFLQQKLDWNNEKVVLETLKNISLKFKYINELGKSNILLNGVDVETTIREMEVSNHVSEVAAIQAVREFAVAQQQAMGEQKGIVMDGRDIGTTVFPNAELKIFVTASTEIRVDRRFKEMLQSNSLITKNEIKENLEHRDLIDSTRTFSPLKKADDAKILDNSNIDREQQLAIALNWSNELINA